MLSNGSFKLFRLFGVTVYLHWTWFLVAVYQVQEMTHPQSGMPSYKHWSWAVVEYLFLFALVLTHEFGHALACRSVGGVAERIVLWPLGGIAFVRPPERPGAYLWSIAAGPLVNVVFVPITLAAAVLGGVSFRDGFDQGTDWHQFLFMAFVINPCLLVFNMLPVYPLDGGQIARSILWFIIGRHRSLTVAAGLGIACTIIGGLLALAAGDTWLVVMALFLGWQAFNGLRYARALAAQERAEQGDF